MFYYYDIEKLKQGSVYLALINDISLPKHEDLLEYEADTPFSGYPIVENDTLRQATRVELINLGKDFLRPNESIVDGEIVYTPPTLHEQALTIEMTKREFIKLVEALTATFEKPITLAIIEAYVAQAGSDVYRDWTYSNHIYRSDPMLDTVALSFGISAEFLDIMYVNKDILLHKIDNNLPLE